MTQAATETKTVFPCVHMNGTGKDALIENLSVVYAALEVARETLRNAAPNGRDFYIGTWTLKDADAQHRRRLEAIDALQKDLESEMELISNQ